MFVTKPSLREQMHIIIDNKDAQGHQVDGLHTQLDAVPDSYDDLVDFGHMLAELPLRQDWPYVEPNDIEEIWAECDPDRPSGAIAYVNLAESTKRVETAFLSSVCGCVLGKPLEIRSTLYEIRAALEAMGEWPMDDYISEKIERGLPRSFHSSGFETTRENIRYVAPDDDINYTVMGMLLLEKHGLEYSLANLRDAWLYHLPIYITFGPERTMLLKAGSNSLQGGNLEDFDDWVSVLNHFDEKCGALIRADAYGYACPGRPALAAELAWRDASWTHRRTGIYGAMFVAAAIAAAQAAPYFEDDRLAIFDLALKYVPQHSRFAEVVRESLAEVRQASDWIDGYERIHLKYRPYGHCLIYQEIGTMINSFRFAKNIGDGICKQVSQGNDTDSFGATIGSMLGAYFGPGHLEERWLAPFNDTIHVALARFHEKSLSKITKRMGELPKLTANIA